MIRFLFILFGLIIGFRSISQTEIYRTNDGQVHFISEAPLEIIQASSKSLQAVIDAQKNTFAFAIPMRSFHGFNSPLQQEHFNENYMESHKYPRATFDGKIIEQVDLTQAGEYLIRAKGKLNIHGIEQERIIKSKVSIGPETMRISARFTIMLEEHDISIPMIVYQKIAKEIKVDMKATVVKIKP